MFGCFNFWFADNPRRAFFLSARDGVRGCRLVLCDTPAYQHLAQ